MTVHYEEHEAEEALMEKLRVAESKIGVASARQKPPATRARI
jgi:hypothetical protein